MRKFQSRSNIRQITQSDLIPLGDLEINSTHRALISSSSRCQIVSNGKDDSGHRNRNPPTYCVVCSHFKFTLLVIRSEPIDNVIDDNVRSKSYCCSFQLSKSLRWFFVVFIFANERNPFRNSVKFVSLQKSHRWSSLTHSPSANSFPNAQKPNMALRMELKTVINGLALNVSLFLFASRFLSFALEFCAFEWIEMKCRSINKRFELRKTALVWFGRFSGRSRRCFVLYFTSHSTGTESSNNRFSFSKWEAIIRTASNQIKISLNAAFTSTGWWFRKYFHCFPLFLRRGEWSKRADPSTLTRRRESSSRGILLAFRTRTRAPSRIAYVITRLHNMRKSMWLCNRWAINRRSNRQNSNFMIQFKFSGKPRTRFSAVFSIVLLLFSMVLDHCTLGIVQFENERSVRIGFASLFVLFCFASVVVIVIVAVIGIVITVVIDIVVVVVSRSVFYS